MEIIIGIALIVFLLASVFLPWVQRGKIQALEFQLQKLKAEMQSFRATSPQPAPRAEESVAMSRPIPRPTEEIRRYMPPPAQPTSKKTDPTPKNKISFEQQFGARLPVWVGGIALALSGLFMVKYSIENQLISPAVRVLLGGLFGIGLLYVAQRIRIKPHFANGVRISQALSGAAIADLYICIFAATNLYDLIPPILGFTGMAATTALAVVLSLRHGAPIALLGLLGGFLTPALISAQSPSAPLLFIYLYFVLTGLFAVIRKRSWWLLSIPTVLAALLWVVYWLDRYYQPADSISLGLFLIAISGTIVFYSKKPMEENRILNISDFNISSLLNYVSMGGAVLLMSAVAVKSNFGLLEWGMFGLLSAGGIALSYFNQKLYGFVPWVSLAANIVMLSLWHQGDPHTWMMILLAFALIYSASGYALMWRAAEPFSFAALAAAASVGYYLLAYHENAAWLTALVPNLPVWGLLALVLAFAAVYAIKQTLQTFAHHSNKTQTEKILAVFALAATAFVSIGLTIELEREFLSVAFAAELLAVCWINSQLAIKALRIIAAILACVFSVLLAPQILLLIQLTAYSLTEAQLHLQSAVPIVNWPIFQLGLPAIMFGLASNLLRRQKDDRLVYVFEIVTIALIGVMGYYLTRHAFHIDENVLFVKAGFVERGVITNIIFIYGLACFWVGRNYARRFVSLAGLVLSAIALFRIAYFDLFIYNPIWSHQEVGALPILNSLLLVYGLPILWLILANRELPSVGKEKYLRYTHPALLLLAFALITFNVRQFYHGEYLDGDVTGNAEIYSYSAAWLLMGIALLFYGTLKREKLVRVASLGIMILSVGKVFLYDASELEGLFRVFSFLGLGISLIGLSWFYTRFVFNSQEEK